MGVLKQWNQWYRPRISDDRGISRDIEGEIRSFGWWKERDRQLGWKLAKARMKAAMSWRRIGFLIAADFLIVFLVVSLVVSPVLRPLFMAVGISMALVVSMLLWPIDFGAMKLILLRAKRCAICCHSLNGLPPDPSDQCIVCPECGAAWRI